jgi:hypothetical protein
MVKESAEEFLKKGYAIIQVPNSFVLAKAVAEGFQSFLQNTPPEDRHLWSFDLPENEDPDGSPDVGFILRTGGDRKVSGGRYDAKFLFHYLPILESLLFVRKVGHPFQSPWLSACKELHKICWNAAVDLVREIDGLMPEYNFLERFMESGDKNVIRIIQYSERGIEDPLVVGKKHADRNFITLQIAESQKGLRIYPEGADGAPVCYEALPNNVLAFPSKKFEAITNGGVEALNHDIVNLDPVSPPRWSVIFFSHIKLSLQEPAKI